MEPCIHGARGHSADHVVRLHARHTQLRQAQHLQGTLKRMFCTTRCEHTDRTATLCWGPATCEHLPHAHALTGVARIDGARFDDPQVMRPMSYRQLRRDKRQSG